MAKSYGFRDIRVQGTGPFTADVWLIGEGPGSQEEKEGEPFVGQAGRVLDSMLGAAGIERRQCRIDNITQFKPYGDKALAFMRGSRPSDTYLEGITNITTQLEKHRPNVVVAVGAYALWGLTMEEKITNWRGSIMESPLVEGQKVIPILHPAYLMRGQWHMRVPTVWDLQKAKVQSKFPEINIPKYDVTVAKTPAQLDDAYRELSDAKKISFDIETFGGRDLACIGFAPNGKRAIVVPFDGRQTIELYKAILESGVPLIAQNAMFEMTYLPVCSEIYPKNIVWDTMIASHAMYPTLPKDLGFLSSIYTDQPYYKEDRAKWRNTGSLDTLWQYNAKDCCVTLDISERQEPDLDMHGARECYDFMHSLLEPYAEATIKGVRCDTGRLDEMIDEVDNEAKVLQNLLDDRFGRSINVRSPKQMKELIYDELKLPPRKVKGKLTTQQDTLIDLAAKTESPELYAIVKLRRALKLRSNYATRDVLDDDQRFRCNYTIPGTKTGRLSSSKTLWDAGMNLQNQPSGYREVFIPDPGKVFLGWDLSQAEAVVVAYEAGDEMEIEWHKQDLDSHLMLAAYMMDKDPSDVSPEERYLHKRCHHALNYRMGPLKFAMVVNGDYDETGIGLTAAEARLMRDRYLVLRPALPAWWQDTMVKLRMGDPPRLHNLLYRSRPFIEQWGDELVNDAISWVPQSTVADVTHLTVKRYWEDPYFQELRQNGHIDFLLQTHDGGVLQVTEGLFDEVCERFTKHALVELESEKGGKFTIRVDVSRGYSWGKMDKVGKFG